MNGMFNPYMPMTMPMQSQMYGGYPYQPQGMFSPFTTGFNFPSQIGGISYPQFNMGFNSYQGMFSQAMPEEAPQMPQPLPGSFQQALQNLKSAGIYDIPAQRQYLTDAGYGSDFRGAGFAMTPSGGD